VFAFGLSERAHGADVYSTDMVLTPDGDGGYRANGVKYYIGNGNAARMVSTFGKFADSGEYVFFAADAHHPNYELIGNIVNSQIYVSTYALHDYPVNEGNILHRGEDAWNAALNTVNVGKFNLGSAAVGAAHTRSMRRSTMPGTGCSTAEQSPTSRTSAGCSPTRTRDWWR
jgi:acyl-CoA dehydrogenase